MTVYVDPFPQAGSAAVAACGPQTRTVPDIAAAQSILDADPAVLLVVLGPGVGLGAALEFAAGQRIGRPQLGVLLLRDAVELDVLAEAIRAGVREVMPAGDPGAIGAACERSRQLSRQLAAAPAGPTEEARVVTVFAGKGGCGKSTMATNLAVALADGGRSRVCLVDLDLQFGDVGIMLQLTPERGIANAVPMAGRLDEDGLRSMLTRYRPGLDTLLAPARPAEGDRVGRELVSELFGVARTMFDYVVVDTPPFFSDPVLAALDLTDWYVLIVTPDLPTLKSARLTMDMFDLLEYPAQRRLALLNRADSQVGLSIADIERAAGAPMAIHVPSSRDVPVSINRGVPITVDSPGHPVSRAINELADRCRGVQAGRPERGRRGRRIFGRRG